MQVRGLNNHLPIQEKPSSRPSTWSHSQVTHVTWLLINHLAWQGLLSTWELSKHLQIVNRTKLDLYYVITLRLIVRNVMVVDWYMVFTPILYCHPAPIILWTMNLLRLSWTFDSTWADGLWPSHLARCNQSLCFRYSVRALGLWE